MYKAPVKRSYLSSPTDVNWSRYFRDNHELCVNIIPQRGCSAYVSPCNWRFFIVYFSYVVRKVRAELQRRECWSEVETENDTALSPALPSSFSFSFQVLLSRGCISYFTKHERKNNNNKKPLATHRKLCICLGVSNKVREGIERVQYFKRKGNVTTMLKQSLQEVKPTWHIKTTYNMRTRQMVSTSTVNNTFKKNMLKQSWICLTEAFFK